MIRYRHIAVQIVQFSLSFEAKPIAYDAAYLALALDTGLPLATRDVELRRAAEAEGVLVI